MLKFAEGPLMLMRDDRVTQKFLARLFAGLRRIVRVFPQTTAMRNATR